MTMDLSDLELTPDLAIPVDIATVALSILGVRGSGKTNTAVDFVEELLKREIPVVVVDTVGVWWGLRTTSDGESGAYPVVVFGGEHGDVPLEEASGKIIADAVLDYGMSAVIDTSGLSKAGARRFLLAFVLHIYHRKAKDRTPLHVVFDEADELAPQQLRGGDPVAAKLLSAMEDFVRRGRSRGLGCTLVTQRPASINKDVLTQVDLLVLMRMSGFTDIKAVNDWVSVQGQAEQARLVRESLAALETGTGWIWWPQFLPAPQLVKFRQRLTFDSSATPKLGQVAIVPTKRAEVDLTQLGEQIAATVEKAKADDPAALRAQILALEKQLRNQPAGERVEVPVEVIREVPVEVSVVPDEFLDQLSLFTDAVNHQIAHGDAWVRDIIAALEKTSPTAAQQRVAPPVILTAPREKKLPAPAPTPAPRPAAAPGEGTTTLGKAARTVLAVLATYGERTHVQLALLAGYSAKSGGFRNTLGALRSTGLILGGRDAIAITPDGLTALGEYDPLPTGQALIDHWKGQLGTSHGAVLDALLNAYPRSLTHDEVAEATGYSPASGGFRNTLGKLRTLELIHGGRDAITASDTLGEAL